MKPSAKARERIRSFDDLYAAKEPQIFLLIGEPEAELLRAGTVPASVQAQAQMALDTEWPMAKAIARKVG